MPECQHDGCTADATGIWARVSPPAVSVRKRLCAEHAPDMDPIAHLQGADP